MKRVWFGVLLLVALLAGSIAVTGCMCHTHSAISQALHEASALLLDDKYEIATKNIENAQNQWQKNWHLSATFADHDPMEEIDRMFAELGVYLRTENAEVSAALCAELARAVDAMGDAHEPSWWNLL